MACGLLHRTPFVVVIHIFIGNTDPSAPPVLLNAYVTDLEITGLEQKTLTYKWRGSFIPSLPTEEKDGLMLGSLLPGIYGFVKIQVVPTYI